MSSWLSVIIPLALLVVILVMLRPVREAVGRAVDSLRRRMSPRPPSTGVTIIAPDGQEYEVPPDRAPRPSFASRFEVVGGPGRAAIGALLAVLVILGAVQFYRLVFAPRPDQFVVLVAPFAEPGGAVGQTGREVAAALVAQLPQATGERVVARAIGSPPSDASDALATLEREGADVLIWGDVGAGGMLNRESLQPLMVYRPNGPFAPYAWEGYAGRFTMPEAYVLASGPLNGSVVLPPLLGALSDYGAGRVDAAFDTLGALLEQYPALAPPLPRALRGNVMWARGEFGTAADEYRRAINSLSPDAGPQAAPLYNNLGAILQDAGDTSAQGAFDQAIRALAGSDLSALRYNIGIQALRAQNYEEAITSLEIARSPTLIPASTPSAPLLLALADAYRLAGRFDGAEPALGAAAQQAPLLANATPPDLYNLSRTRMDAAVEAERALLNLAQAAGARGPLPWEAENSPPLPVTVLTEARSDLNQAVDSTEVLGQRWSRLSIAKDAAAEPAAGQIATRQALRAQDLLRDRRRWLAGVDIEIERTQGIQEPRGLGRVWAAIAGDRSPLGLARMTLEDIVAAHPNDVDSLLLLGRSYVLSGDLEKASQYYDRAAQVAPQRPEPLYGQALVALPTDRSRARALLQQALQLNPAYFPAREKLATVAEEDGDWTTAVEQRDWLRRNRPERERRDNTLALAETLRRSGPSGYASAERLLLEYANAGDIDALLALSQLYTDQNNPAAARQVLDRAAQIAPRNPEPPYQLGRLLESQKDEPGAEAAYNRAIAIDATHVPSRLALGALYASQNKLPQASQQYRAALDAGANDPAALKQIGLVLLANRQYDQAADAFQRALDAPGAPADAEIYHGLAQANLARSRLADAEAQEQRALDETNGVYPEALVGLGDIALRREQPTQAVQHYTEALGQNNRLIAAHIGLGRAAAAQGNWSVAEARFRDAVAIDPSSAEAHLWLGEALVRTPSPAAAIPEYARALELQPRYPEAFYGLAQAQAAAGQLDLAQQNLALALQLRESYPDALLLQGKIDEQLRNDDAAIEAYTKAITADDNQAEPYYRRALLYMRRDRLDEAQNDLEQAIKLRPEFPEAHYWLGRAYLAQGQPKQARDELIVANTQRGGSYSDALFYQGMAEEQAGMRAEAVASYEAALAQNAGGDWAGEARTAIERLRQS